MQPGKASTSERGREITRERERDDTTAMEKQRKNKDVSHSIEQQKALGDLRPCANISKPLGILLNAQDKASRVEPETPLFSPCIYIKLWAGGTSRYTHHKS